MSATTWNTSNPAIKRLMKEVASMDASPSPYFIAYPMEDNMFQWHFTMRGPADSPYEQGLYHGKLLLPPNYPFAPPDVVLLTPNGRFELNKKICVSITSYHPENWNPTFNIVTVLAALRDFMSTPGNNAIGAIEYAEDVRKRMAAESVDYCCTQCKQSNVMHRDRMAVVPVDSVGPPSQCPVTPLQVASPAAPITPPMGPLPAANEGTPQEQRLQPPHVMSPMAPPHDEAPEPAMMEDVPVAEALQPPLPAPLHPHPPGGIVLTIRTLDNIIGLVFFAILAILVRKYLAGNLSDVMHFH
jgi:ubiquitin-conjugating enzyme E2 J1